ncbi:MAG: hypothetical protein ACOC2O_01830 [Bacillota bacterium]
MKTMTCKQLGGACDKKFHANTFEEMAELSKKHAMEMVQQGDEAHIKAMNEMKSLMNNPRGSFLIKLLRLLLAYKFNIWTYICLRFSQFKHEF